jgi:hypothetical protein
MGRDIPIIALLAPGADSSSFLKIYRNAFKMITLIEIGQSKIEEISKDVSLVISGILK